MKQIKWWQENRELGILLVIIGVAFSLLSTLGLFLLSGAKNNFGEVDALRNKLQRVRSFSMKHENYQQYVGKLQDKLLALEELVPEKIDMNNLVMELSSKANLHNLQVDGLSLGSTKTLKNNVKVQQIQVSGSGECQDVLDFVKTVESQDNLMRFSEVTLEQKEGNRIALFGKVNVFSK